MIIEHYYSKNGMAWHGKIIEKPLMVSLIAGL